MDKDNIQSGQDYARALIDQIVVGELDVPANERIDSKLLQYWCEEIQDFAEVTWTDYLTGKRESYLFDEDEIRGLYEKAGLRFASDILNSLVDKEMIGVGVRNDGELVYSLTEKGKKHLEGED